ncbi:MAG: Hsp20/alpha crystallin family protein [Cutibacterium granulosum]|uniref:Heat-shock protein Hsp20 n=1 Tax=Cutibacterium granulosum DSM 20700 TaxID=1160719 RepID=U1F9N2_9ACTN|nr:Hsp20/alpha crystallin family protein [Cutibacterium granulosum]ERF56193.1 Hsp20/alpha crystallin family protein [Cutibacterium granulosum DSM 20700]MBX7475061.1 Hsp20/alpha crystallin family protein [Streptomyces sp. MAG02]MDU3768347.1 Hsp20/alpha crystallin family protein [Cutibacterium granulosum]
MNRTFDPFHDIDRLFAEAARTPASVAMPMDLYRDGDKYVAAIDLPGVDPASIDIDVEEGTLTIRAERRSHAGEDAQWLSRERAVGTFARRLNLGSGLATDRISADYSDGVLSLTIPVSEAAKPRKIQVQHGTSGTNEIA